MATPLLHARPPADPEEERTLRKLAAARHAPASWIQRAQIVTGSWDGATVRPAVKPGATTEPRDAYGIKECCNPRPAVRPGATAGAVTPSGRKAGCNPRPAVHGQAALDRAAAARGRRTTPGEQR
jgi:hypothetical protein